MPPRELKTLCKWLGVAALAIIVFNLFVAKAYGQVIRFDTTLQEDRIGETGCDSNNTPAIIIRAGMDGVTTLNTIAHELTHYRQMVGDCKAFLVKYNHDIRFKVSMEAEAYCERTTRIANPDVREFYADEQVMFIFHLYGRGGKAILYSEVKKIVLKACGGADEPP
jgi:hypothetical protein